MRRAEPGELVALSLGAAGLCSSVVLVRKGLRPTSSCIRSSWPLRLAAGFLLAHVVFTLPFDPLRWVGSHISRRV